MQKPNDPLDWSHAVGEVPARGLEVRRTATPGECEALSVANAPARFTALSVHYRLRPLAKGRFALEGELHASVVQTCVVSLEPIGSQVREAFRLEFWPEEQVEDPPMNADGAIDLDLALADALDVEPYGTDGRLPVGRIFAEAATLAIDPYPRRADASLETVGEVDPADSRRENPFAVLAVLRDKKLPPSQH